MQTITIRRPVPLDPQIKIVIDETGTRVPVDTRVYFDSRGVHCSDVDAAIGGPHRSTQVSAFLADVEVVCGVGGIKSVAPSKNCACALLNHACGVAFNLSLGGVYMWYSVYNCKEEFSSMLHKELCDGFTRLVGTLNSDEVAIGQNGTFIVVVRSEVVVGADGTISVSSDIMPVEITHYIDPASSEHRELKLPDNAEKYTLPVKEFCVRCPVVRYTPKPLR